VLYHRDHSQLPSGGRGSSSAAVGLAVLCIVLSNVVFGCACSELAHGCLYSESAEIFIQSDLNS
jgi:hypothetical protein